MSARVMNVSDRSNRSLRIILSPPGRVMNDFRARENAIAGTSRDDMNSGRIHTGSGAPTCAPFDQGPLALRTDSHVTPRKSHGRFPCRRCVATAGLRSHTLDRAARRLSGMFAGTALAGGHGTTQYDLVQGYIIQGSSCAPSCTSATCQNQQACVPSASPQSPAASAPAPQAPQPVAATRLRCRWLHRRPRRRRRRS